MPLPPVLIILAVIALVLHILFNYLLVPPPATSWPYYHRPLITILVIVMILIFWFVLPIHVG